MKNAISAMLFLMLSLPVSASDWAVKWDHANIMKDPSVNAMKVYTLKRAQYARITDITMKGAWLKVRFDAYLSRKDYKLLRAKGAEIKRFGGEGNVVQAKISGWTKKKDLRER